ncbi:MAG: hypothetical protein PVF58_13945 [Candidatus Methanofastidiosia archaeon]|jgi:hypothetical protein
MKIIKSDKNKNLLIIFLLGLLISFMVRTFLDDYFADDIRINTEKWKIDKEEGFKLVNTETGEVYAGEKWTNDRHQVWVHVPGEGLRGGHWEDDLDEDGVAASVDDDDNDPTVGDEDPDKP